METIKTIPTKPAVAPTRGKALVPKLRFKGFEIDLEISRLDELATFKSGGTPSKDNPAYWGGYIPWISAASMDGKYYSTSERMLTEEGLKNGSKLATKGSLLLLVRGSMLFNKIPIGIAEIDVAFNQDLKALSINKNTNTEFLYQWFFSKQNLLLNKVVGTGIGAGKLDTEELKNLIIHIPTLPEQQKIASFLSAVDEKIQQLSRKKELLESYKKGVMQQLFSGKLRFKGENGKAFPKWEEKRLGDITTLLKDGTHGTHKDYPEGNHFLLSAKNIYNGSIKIDDSDRRISEEEYNSIYKNYHLQKNDILLTIVGTIGRVAIFKNEQNIAFQRSVAFFRFKDQCADFLLQLMSEIKFQKELDLRKVISAQPGIYLGDLAKIQVKLPCLEEQKKIAYYLSNIDTKIEILNNQITQTQTFKKGLLQQMFV